MDKIKNNDYVFKPIEPKCNNANHGKFRFYLHPKSIMFR